MCIFGLYLCGPPWLTQWQLQFCNYEKFIKKLMEARNTTKAILQIVMYVNPKSVNIDLFADDGVLKIRRVPAKKFMGPKGYLLCSILGLCSAVMYFKRNIIKIIPKKYLGF